MLSLTDIKQQFDLKIKKIAVCFGLLKNFEIRDLEDTTSYLEQEASPWIITNQLSSVYVTQCGTTWLLGGVGVIGTGGTYERNYDSLPGHTLIYFAITFTIIDPFSTDTLFSIYFDNQLVDTWNAITLITRPSSFECGTLLSPDFPAITIKGQVPHTANTLNLKIESKILISGGSFGFRNVHLMFSNNAGSMISCKFTGLLLGSRSCFCSNDQFGDPLAILPGTFCKDCHASCSTCVGPSISECTSCPGGSSFNGANCVSCHATCDQCIGTAETDCVRCPSGKFLYWDQTCRSDCDYPLVASNEGDRKFCNEPCDSSEFLTWDGSCESACDPPFVPSVIDTVKICSLPCPASEFFYQGATCRADCDYPLVQDMDGDIPTCDVPCTGTDYYYWDDNCYPTCPDPLVPSMDGDVRVCSLPCPLSEFFYPDGSCDSTCETPFVPFIDGDLRVCNFPCSGSDYYYWDDSCHADCDSPLVTDIIDDIPICSLPCPIPEYFYQGATCRTDCNSPLVPVIEGDLRICNLPCAGTDYYYWDNECYPDCLSPLIPSMDGDVRICSLPCPLSEYLYPDGSCKSSCDYPFVPFIDDDLRICNFPCTGSDFLYWDNNCHADCDPPLLSSVEESVNICSLPCPMGEFVGLNSACVSSCDSPFIQVISGDLKTCDSPCSVGDYLYWDGDCSSSCPLPFRTSLGSGKMYCEFHCNSTSYKYWNETCLLSCDPPLKQSIDANGQNICGKPCNGDDFLYQNGTCLEECNSPYLAQMTENEYFSCNAPCPASQFFSKETGTCISSCDPPSIIEQKGLFNVCKAALHDPIFSDTVTTLTEAASGATFGTALANMFLRPGSPSSMAVLALSQLLKYIEFLDLDYPDHVEELFSLDLFGLPSSNSSITNLLYEQFNNELYRKPSLHVFRKREIHSSFVVNYFDQLKFLVPCLVLVLLLWPLEKLVNSLKSKSLPELFKKLKVFIRWNLLLLLFFSGYDDLGLFLSVEFLSCNLDSVSGAFSLIFCVVFVFIAIYLLWLLFKICREFTKPSVYPLSPEESDHKDPLSEKWEPYQMMYFGYQRTSFLKQAYLFFFTLRIVFCFMIVGFLYKFPVPQTILLTLVGFIMLFYILKVKPMKERFDMIETTVYEIIISLVNISVMIFAILEKSGNLSYKLRDNIGTVILILNLTISLAALIFSIIAVLRALLEILNRMRENSKNKVKINPLQILMNPFAVSQIGSSSKIEGGSAVLDVKPRHSTKKRSTKYEIPNQKSNIRDIEYEIYLSKGNRKLQTQLKFSDPEKVLKRINLLGDPGSDTEKWIKSPMNGSSETPFKFGSNPESIRNSFMRDLSPENHNNFQASFRQGQVNHEMSSDFSNMISIANLRDNHTLLNIPEANHFVTDSLTPGKNLSAKSNKSSKQFNFEDWKPPSAESLGGSKRGKTLADIFIDKGPRRAPESLVFPDNPGKFVSTYSRRSENLSRVAKRLKRKEKGDSKDLETINGEPQSNITSFDSIN